MNTENTVRDQADILAENERLTAANATLTAERDRALADLTAANDLLGPAQTNLTAAQAERDKLRQQVRDLTGQVGALTTERDEARTKLATAETRMADFNKAVATEVTKLGVAPKPVERPDGSGTPAAAEDLRAQYAALTDPKQKAAFLEKHREAIRALF